jgi:hypothetical protein
MKPGTGHCQQGQELPDVWATLPFSPIPIPSLAIHPKLRHTRWTAWLERDSHGSTLNVIFYIFYS